MSEGGPVNNAMGKNDPTNAGYDQPPPSYDQTNAGYNQPGQNQPPQQGYYQPPSAPSGQPQPVVYGQPQPVVYGQPQPNIYGQPQQVVYGQPQPGSSYVMPVAASNNTVIVQNMALAPPSYMVLACLVFWFCNCLLGGIAVILSYASQNAAENGDTQQARSMGKASMWTSIAGVIVSIVAITIIIIVSATTNAGCSGYYC